MVVASLLPLRLCSSSLMTLLRRRTVSKEIRLGFVPGLVAATLLAWGCDRPATPVSPKPSYEVGGSGTCPAGEKFTGSGRIDPPGGKTTFGFHVDARDWCRSGGSLKGRVQTVIHGTKTRIHSVSIDDFSSFQDPERGGQCVAFSGTARVKDGNGSWRQEHFGVIACDNGPRCSSGGPGPDRYGISLQEDGRETGVTDLRGGNIHAQ